MNRIVRYIVYLLLISTAGVLLAQTSAARLQGTVKDASGAVVPKARITIALIATGASLSSGSNEAGLYVFPSLQAGKYRLTVDVPGMEKWQGDLELLAGQEAAFDPVVKVAGTSTTITVAGDVTPLVTDTGPTLTNIVERERIEQLPIDGRQFYNLMVLTTPGLEEGASGTQRPEPFGLREGIVEIQQDGAAMNNDNTGMITWAPPGLDTVQQYNVEMSVSSARYEKPITGVLSTRSGTNQWHGGLFYTGRNNGFGLARKRQDSNEAPELIRSEFGASLGGPVRLPHYNGKNRTFFFVSYEGLRLRQAVTFSEAVPTAAMRQGDFSQLTNSSGQTETLYNPWSTGNAASNYARTPFQNNQIPISLISPLSKYAYSVLQLPTLANANPAVTANWWGPNPSAQGNNTFTTRLDHHLSDRDQVFVRYTIGVYLQRQKYASGSFAPTLDDLWGFQTAGEHLQTPMATWNHTFSPRFFVETLGIWSNSDWKFCQQCPADTQNNLAKFGLPNPFNRIGAPELDNTGFGYAFDAVGQRSEDTRKYVAEQNYTLIAGKHMLRFGWHFQNESLNVMVDRPTGETINFASSATGLYDPTTGNNYTALNRTGDNAANFFLGAAGSYTQGASPGNLSLGSRSIEGYFQDDWKIRRDLTLNLGMRYDYLPTLIDAGGMNRFSILPIMPSCTRQPSLR